MTTTNNNFRVKNGLEVTTTASMATLQFTGDSSVQTTAYTGTGTLVANAVNAEVAAYADAFNTGTLVAVAVDVLNGVGVPLITAEETTATTTATGKLVSISDNGGRLAYYNNTVTDWLYVATEAVVYTPPAPPAPGGPPVTDYIAWYDMTSVDLGTNTWTDKSVNAYNGTIVGTPSIVSATGNGASETFNSLSGGTSDKVTFPSAILPATYTLFHICRYSGGSQRRIITTAIRANPFWLSGHYDGTAGVAYRDGWVGTDPAAVNYGTNWVISADQNYFYRPNGNTACQGTGGNGASSDLTVNGMDELSDWQCAEIIVYNRTLNSTEISDTETYLATKYGITLGV